jgi:hypothetical protein
MLVGAVTENQSPPCGFLVLSGSDCELDQRNPSHLGSANPEGQVLLDRIRKPEITTTKLKRLDAAIVLWSSRVYAAPNAARNLL